MALMRSALLALLVGAGLGWAFAEFFTGGEPPPIDIDIRSVS